MTDARRQFFPVDPVDLLAFNDVLQQMTGEIDSETLDRAVDFRAALEKVKKEVALAISLVDSALIQRLESPQVRDGMMYEVVPKPEKVTYDHDLVLSKVQQVAAVDEQTGEFHDAPTALSRMADAIRALYLSPSTKPKAGGMKSWSINRGMVEHKEWGGKRVKVTDTRFTDGDDDE